MSDNNWPDRTGRKSRFFCSRYANCNVHDMQIAMSHNPGPDFLLCLLFRAVSVETLLVPQHHQHRRRRRHPRASSLSLSLPALLSSSALSSSSSLSLPP